MKERPILFSGEMVRAILDGRKTQTRRVVKPQPRVIHALYCDASCETNLNFGKYGRIHCKFGMKGDQLWVKETFGICSGIEPAKPKFGHKIYYRSTMNAKDGSPAQEKGIAKGWPVDKWRPSIFMPRFASRITLEIVSVRVERLQEISEEDAKAEGITIPECVGLSVCAGGCNYCEVKASPIQHYRKLWEKINGAGSWDANPWVWVIEFKRVAL